MRNFELNVDSGRASSKILDLSSYFVSLSGRTMIEHDKRS